jgi:EAL domain-containing protein (putative c-di-GMP-specific phosphodiesterase class I)
MQADRLLILDDDAGICDFVEEVAESLGFSVSVPGLPFDINDRLKEFQPSLIFLDLQMPGKDGIEVIRQLGEAGAKVQIVLASGQDRQILHAARNLAQKRGLAVLDCLNKPLRLEILEATLRRGLSAAALIDHSALRQAIASGELLMQYQPKVVIGPGEVWRTHSLEALVRWQHPDLGLLPPGLFIDLAERHNLIVDLTDYVIGSVLRQMTVWQRDGIAIPVAVNLSAHFIDDLGLPDRLANLAADHAIDTGLLALEITESSAMADVSRAMDVLTRLRLKGFRLSIDDFGTGYSSLIQLFRMPFSELKIDREFISGLPDDPESAIIVKGIVNLAHALELKVCAEGVESEAAFTFLKHQGCDLYQGHHFSPAISADEVTALLQSESVPVPKA